jgi:hypothetical protein
MPPVAETKGTSSYLILNPAAGSAATLTESLTRAARERGIGVHVLEAGEDARHAARGGSARGGRRRGRLEQPVRVRTVGHVRPTPGIYGVC